MSRALTSRRTSRREKHHDYSPLASPAAGSKFYARVLGRVFEFIEGVRLGGDPSARVLVHCNQGVSRSASCVIFWVMQRERCGFDAALRRVQGCREVAHPNSSFERQLRAAEKGHCVLM